MDRVAELQLLDALGHNFTACKKFGLGAYGTVGKFTLTESGRQTFPELPGTVVVKSMSLDHGSPERNTLQRHVINNELEIFGDLKQYEILNGGPLAGSVKYYTAFRTQEPAEHVHIVMALAPGSELFELITEDDFQYGVDLATKLAIVNQIAIVLHKWHKAGFIHRDIKTENIVVNLINREAQPPIVEITFVDYGFACNVKKAEPSESSKWLRHRYLGTKALTDPLSKPTSLKSLHLDDWWSYGQLIYVVLTGYSLYSRSKGFKVAPYHMMMSRGLSRQLCDLIQRLTDPVLDRTVRPTPEEILQCLSSVTSLNN